MATPHLSPHETYDFSKYTTGISLFNAKTVPPVSSLSGSLSLTHSLLQSVRFFFERDNSAAGHCLASKARNVLQHRKLRRCDYQFVHVERDDGLDQLCGGSFRTHKTDAPVGGALGVQNRLFYQRFPFLDEHVLIQERRRTEKRGREGAT
jgi:hypothetical protein